MIPHNTTALSTTVIVKLMHILIPEYPCYTKREREMIHFSSIARAIDGPTYNYVKQWPFRCNTTYLPHLVYHPQLFTYDCLRLLPLVYKPSISPIIGYSHIFHQLICDPSNRSHNLRFLVRIPNVGILTTVLIMFNRFVSYHFTSHYLAC